MNIKSKLTSIVDRIISFSFYLSSGLVVFMIVGITLQVLDRKTFKIMPMWINEVSEYLLVYMTFLGAAWVLKQDRHVIMDTLISKLGSISRASVNMFTSMVGSVLCFATSWYAVSATWEKFQQGYTYGQHLSPPWWLILVPIPIGTFLLAIQFARRAYEHFNIIRTQRRESLTAEKADVTEEGI
jgi:TRAP-type C4-dicarboxylate transport system permease small subunit